MNSAMTNTNSGLFIDDGGAGRLPVVFLHSMAGNTGHWEAQLAHLRSDRRAIALDLLGHGRSAADDQFSFESMAHKIRVAISELDLKRFVLVGHSMGGSVATAYAGAYPEDVAGLFLVDPSGDSTQMPKEEVQGYLDALHSPAYQQVIEEYWQGILEGSTAETREQVMADLRHTSQHTVRSVSEELFNYNPLPALDRYDGPIFSLITRFNEFPNSLQVLRPRIEHKKIEGTGHWLQMDKPQEFNEILEKWLMEFC